MTDKDWRAFFYFLDRVTLSNHEEMEEAIGKLGTGSMLVWANLIELADRVKTRSPKGQTVQG